MTTNTTATVATATATVRTQLIQLLNGWMFPAQVLDTAYKAVSPLLLDPEAENVSKLSAEVFQLINWCKIKHHIAEDDPQAVALAATMDLLTAVEAVHITRLSLQRWELVTHFYLGCTDKF